MKVDWLIVGAGFSGCTLAERIASQLDQTVLVVDRRDHVGGNAYDYYDEHGILVHKYGPHVFHTNCSWVWEYVSQFTSWRPYYHRVEGVVDGLKIPIPFNLNSLAAVFPVRYASRLESLLMREYGFGVKVPILKLRQSQNRDLQCLADYVYKNVFYGYTVKQWNLTPEELDPSVTGRIPLYVSRDDRYFQDQFQALPTQGYTELFRRMLKSPKIKVLLNTSYTELIDQINFNRLIYTGPIDEYFDHMHGELPYRSLTFEFANYAREQYQSSGAVNYPNEHAFTRISEFKHMTGQSNPSTTVAIEYPRPYVRGENEPYYPIPRTDHREQFSCYQKEAAKLNGTVLFVGRLADYKYYNMDQAIARALKVFEQEVVR